MRQHALKIYLLFVLSWFVHLPARIPALAAIRFDMLLIAALVVLAFLSRDVTPRKTVEIDKWLRVLMAYAVITLPFTEWPGSVLKEGIPNFIKAVVFYYFTVCFVKTERDLKLLLYTFLGCQIFRVLEPLYLHVTTGYWGSSAAMAGGEESLRRLSGSPFDVINPNGLAAIVCTVLPFLYFLGTKSFRHALLALALAVPCLYAFSLTGSRSGMVGVAVVFAGIVVKSRYAVPLAIAGAVAAVVAFSSISPDMQDRYLSIVGLGEKNVGTASERFGGLQSDFDVALRKPVFGHGLGTSAEANANFAQIGPYAGVKAVPAHNLLLEVMQEIGLVGLVFYLLLLKSILSMFFGYKPVFEGRHGTDFLQQVFSAMQVWLVMNLVFSLASYGLSNYAWYLFAGMAVVLYRLLQERELAKPVAEKRVTAPPIADMAMFGRPPVDVQRNELKR